MFYSKILISASINWEENNGSFEGVVKVSKEEFEKRSNEFFDKLSSWLNSADILSIIVDKRDFNIFLPYDETKHYIEDEAIELIHGFINEVFYNADRLDFVLEIHVEDDIDVEINVMNREKIDSNIW